MTCDVLIENLRCTAPDGRTILELPHLAIEAGERIAIVGPNGAGKSTLLRCLSGFRRPQGGRVQVLQRELGNGLAAHDLRQLRCQVAQVLQGLHLVHRLSVVENVLIGALGRLPGWRSWVRWHRPADVAEAMRALAAVGLEAKAGDRTDRLSGGERQKTCIARLMMQRPRLILADEPTASLDPAAARDICALLRQCAAQATLISVVHQAELLPWLADRVIGLRDGRPVFDLRVENLDPERLSILYGPAAANAADAANAMRKSSATRHGTSAVLPNTTATLEHDALQVQPPSFVQVGVG